MFGCFRILFLCDVAEAIRLDLLRSLRGPTAVELSSNLTPPPPQYLRFERPPVSEPIDPVTLETGESVAGRIKYYDYGVVSIEFELPFAGDWGTMVLQSSRWSGATELQSKAAHCVRVALNRITPALVKPSETWLGKTTTSFNFERSLKAIAHCLQGNCFRRMRTRSPNLFGANPSRYPRRSVKRFCNRASRIRRRTW